MFINDFSSSLQMIAVDRSGLVIVSLSFVVRTFQAAGYQKFLYLFEEYEGSQFNCHRFSWMRLDYHRDRIRIGSSTAIYRWASFASNAAKSP